jgi:hypothetical protein
MSNRALVGSRITREKLQHAEAHLYIYRCSRGYQKRQGTSCLPHCFIRNFSTWPVSLMQTSRDSLSATKSSKVRLTRGNVLLMHRWAVIIINDVTLVASASLDTRFGCKARSKTTSVLRMQSEAKWVVNKRYSRLSVSRTSCCWCSPESTLISG